MLTAEKKTCKKETDDGALQSSLTVAFTGCLLCASITKQHFSDTQSFNPHNYFVEGQTHLNRGNWPGEVNAKAMPIVKRGAGM